MFNHFLEPKTFGQIIKRLAGLEDGAKASRGLPGTQLNNNYEIDVIFLLQAQDFGFKWEYLRPPTTESTGH